MLLHAVYTHLERTISGIRASGHSDARWLQHIVNCSEPSLPVLIDTQSPIRTKSSLSTNPTILRTPYVTFRLLQFGLVYE